MPSGTEIYGDIVVFGIVVRVKAHNSDLLRIALTLFPPCDGSHSRHDISKIYLVLNSRPVAAAIAADIREQNLHIIQEHLALDADGLKGEGTCSFAPELTDEAVIREAINTVVLFLVGHAGRIPVHASAIMLGNTAVILAGKSGSGKSSLALAADRARLQVLSDDTVFVQTKPHLRVWALGGAVHVFEKDAPADAAGTMRLRSGRWKRALPIAQPRHHADRAALCVLQRGDEVSLAPMPEDEAISVLTEMLEPGYEFYGTRMTEALRALAAGGCWRLSLGRDPAAAIAALQTAWPVGISPKVSAQ